ncbi:TlpA family protein disulfide reductase [Salinimicrobium gaetbulicola]|uniref:TlpA family protein disulfide reductase n=1 Tax=Salinimicrobium gaetbulicola TaxID=999702 RepID=A0ABW3ICV6_9FLAO
MKTLFKNISALKWLAAYLLGFIFISFYSCDNSPSNQTNSAYLGGEIVNPTSEYIVLQKNGKILDSIRLDDRNRFSYRIDSVQQGIYSFGHRPEIQHFYISPGDSLLIRANTLAFDESLHFSGTGEAENNFITEMFLLDEANADLLLSFYKTSPSEFLKQTDSIKRNRLEHLERLKVKKKFSPEFVTLAEKIINYESYDLKERYIYLISKYYTEYQQKLPDNFYEYRKNVVFNDTSLQETAAYKRFIENYLTNKSLELCKRTHKDHEECFDRANTKNILNRIKMVGDLIKIPSLKNHFLLKLGAKGIVLARSREDIKVILEALRKNGFPEDQVKDMEQLGTIQLAYLPGTEIKDVPLINTKEEFVPFLNIVDKPTIIFLWSIYKDGHQEDHKLIQELRRKYPEINFVGINLDIDETTAWKIAVQKYNYNKDFEYQLGQTQINKRFFQYYLNKLLFLDDAGKVVIGDAFINSPEFESRILEFLNR